MKRALASLLRRAANKMDPPRACGTWIGHPPDGVTSTASNYGPVKWFDPDSPSGA